MDAESSSTGLDILSLEGEETDADVSIGISGSMAGTEGVVSLASEDEV